MAIYPNQNPNDYGSNTTSSLATETLHLRFDIFFMDHQTSQHQTSCSEQSYKLPAPEQLAAEIERDDYFQQEQEQKSKQKNALNHSTLKVLTLFFKSFVIDPKTVRGQKLVTADADKESRLLAATGSITNLIGTIGVAPIIIFTMSNLGILSLPVAVILLYLLNSAQNSYTIAVARKAGNRKVRDVSGLIGIVGMQVILTGASLGGMLVLNSQTTLANYHAQALAESKREQILDQKQRVLDSPETVEIKGRCEQGKQDIKNTTPNDPNRHRFIIETHGSYADTQRLGVPSTPESYCGKWNTLRQEIQARFDAILEPHNQAESEGQPPVAILRTVYPDTYRGEFKDGKIADGNTAIAAGFSYALRELLSGKISSLGSSLLFLALSATTSTALIIGLIVHSKRKAILISFSDGAEQAVNSFFKRYAEKQSQSESEREALQAIAYYHQQHVQLGGVVAIPSLIEFIRFADQKDLFQLVPPAVSDAKDTQASSLRESIDACTYQIRNLLHLLATTIKPHTYALQTNLKSTTDALKTGDVEEISFVFGQMLRQLMSLVHQVKEIAQTAKKDVTALVMREAEVLELLSPDGLKQQLCVVDRIQPQSFLHSRLESLDRLQTECHSLLN